MSNPSKCVFSGFGGHSHPYSECIATIEETMPNAEYCSPFGVECISDSVGALFDYATALITDSSTSLSKECKKVLGSKYVLQTGTNCTLPNGTSAPRYKYINSVQSSNLGILPAALNSATNINGMEMINSFTEELEPPCRKIQLACHVMNKEPGVDNDYIPYTNSSGWVNIPVYDISYTISSSDIVSQGNSLPENIPAVSSESAFSNINNVNNTNDTKNVKNNNLDTMDDLLNKYKDLYSNNNNNNNDNKKNIHNLDEDSLTNLYFICISLFLIFITYKLIHKK